MHDLHRAPLPRRLSLLATLSVPLTAVGCEPGGRQPEVPAEPPARLALDTVAVIHSDLLYFVQEVRRDPDEDYMSYARQAVEVWDGTVPRPFYSAVISDGSETLIGHYAHRSADIVEWFFWTGTVRRSAPSRLKRTSGSSRSRTGKSSPWAATRWTWSTCSFCGFAKKCKSCTTRQTGGIEMSRTIAVTLLAAAGTAPTATAAQDRPLTSDFPEVYRVGGLSAPDWAQFTNPSRMGFDTAGNLYVLDPSAFQVVVTGPGGELVMAVGREGEGPGEFRNPTDLVVWRDGRFAVVDIRHGAYQIFGPAGELGRFVRMNPVAGQPGVLAARDTVRADPRGSALIASGGRFAAAFAAGMAAGRAASGDDTDEEFEAVGEDERLDRLDLRGEAAVAETIVRARHIPPDGTERRGLYFAPRLIWDVLPDGAIAYVDSTAYEVILLGDDGTPRGVLERPLGPETVTARIRSAVREHRLRELEAAPMDAERPEFMSAEQWEEMQEMLRAASREGIENQEFFPEIPVLRGLRSTWDGSLWVQRRGDDPWDDAGPIDVFGPDGNYRGTLAAGRLGMPRAFGPDGLVAFVEKDEMDVPTIVVKRLTAGVR